MKKTFAIILSILFAFVSLQAFSGCFLRPGDHSAAASPKPTANPTASPEPTAEPTEEPTPEPTPTPTPTPEPTPEPTPTPEPLGEYAQKCVEAAEKRMDQLIEFIDRNPIECDSAVHPFVPYDRRAELSDEEAAIYDLMLEAAESFTDFSFEAESSVVEAASEALYLDRPDILTYFSPELYLKEGEAEPAWHALYYLPEGRYHRAAEDMGKVREQVEAFRAVGKYVASRIPERFSVIDKYRALAYYISMTSQYCHVHGEIPPYATCAYGALINGYSICQGYALGFEYLCREANLDCTRRRNAYNDENMHFWDEVTLDGGTYYVDVTWSDGSVMQYRDAYWFEWFMFTADRHHVANDGTSTTGQPLGLLGMFL